MKPLVPFDSLSLLLHQTSGTILSLPSYIKHLAPSYQIITIIHQTSGAILSNHHHHTSNIWRHLIITIIHQTSGAILSIVSVLTSNMWCQFITQPQLSHHTKRSVCHTLHYSTKQLAVHPPHLTKNTLPSNVLLLAHCITITLPLKLGQQFITHYPCLFNKTLVPVHTLPMSVALKLRYQFITHYKCQLLSTKTLVSSHTTNVSYLH